MNRLELRKKLIAADVDERFFSLEGELRDECLILDRKSSNLWIVFYNERGLRTNEHFFDSEDDANAYMLTTLLRDPLVRRKETGKPLQKPT